MVLLLLITWIIKSSSHFGNGSLVYTFVELLSYVSARRVETYVILSVTALLQYCGLRSSVHWSNCIRWNVKNLVGLFVFLRSFKVHTIFFHRLRVFENWNRFSCRYFEGFLAKMWLIIFCVPSVLWLVHDSLAPLKTVCENWNLLIVSSATFTHLSLKQLFDTSRNTNVSSSLYVVAALLLQIHTFAFKTDCTTVELTLHCI